MNPADFHFIRPFWLLALLPALLITYLLLKNKLNKGNWSSVCDAELLPFVLQEKPEHKSRRSLSTGVFSALLIVFSLAGPTWERLPTPVFRNDAALVIALDLSRSMDATDIKPSRLSMARFKITDILKQRKDGQTALIVYAGDAFTVTPLTEDRETIISQISALSTNIMPSPGSNTSIAIETAINLLKQAGLQTGEILLVTDGIDYDKTIDTVESIPGYKLSILGVGTADGAPIKLKDGGFLKDRQGNIVVPKLDASTLANLTNSGSGLYQSISQDDSDIQAILKQVDKPAEKQESTSDLLIEQWHERGPWLLLLALPFVALNFRKGILLAFIFILPFPENSYAMEWQDLWQNQNQQAQKAFNKQNYQDAAEQFENPQWKAAAQYKSGQFDQVIESLQDDQSVTGLYNKGNALAKAGKLPEALEAYKHALTQSPDHEDALYNKEQVEKLLEQQKQNQQQDKNQQQSEQQDQNQDQQKDQSEQSGEQSSEQQQNQQNNQQNNDQQQNTDNSEQQEQDKQQEAKENPSEKNDQEQSEQAQAEQKEQTETAQPKPVSEYDEAQQANEQWLNRIPDDPAGLLKRKFKYQYGKRNRKPGNNQAW